MAAKKPSKEEQRILQKIEERMNRPKTEIWQKLESADLLLALSWMYISNKYFEKSASWLHHKIDGYDKNGNVVMFTDDEIKTLKEAIKDLSQRLDSFAETL